MKIFDDQYIVITGGAGLIGSSVIRVLNDLGHSNLIICDDLGEDERWKNLLGKDFIDIVSKHDIFDWLVGREEEVEAFIHLGACSSTVEKNADFLLDNNYKFSVHLADFALTHGIRFIYASSAATYGDGSLGFSDDPATLEELRPLNMYGYSKQLFDLWVKKHEVLNAVTGLKYFNVFGPNEPHKGRMASAVYHFYNQIKNTGQIQLFKSSEPEKFSDGGQMRDFIYVKDAARITADLLKKDIFGIYNLGTGKANTWNALGKAVFKGLGKPDHITYIDMPEDLVGKYQNFTEAKMDRLAKAWREPLDFTPFEESVVDYVQNYLEKDKRW